MNTRNLLISFVMILISMSISVSQNSHKVSVSAEDISFTKVKGDDGVDYDKIHFRDMMQLH